MAHGTPDWGVTAGARTVYQLTDLGELAARLGSPITHDRRGDVVWWDDFEWGLNKWETAIDGAGGSVALTAARCRNGQQSVLLKGGAAGAQSASMAHRTALPAVGMFGAEFSFQFESSVNHLDLTLGVRSDNGWDTYVLRYDDANNELEYMNAAGGFTLLAFPVLLSNAETLFHTMKLVVDIDDRVYVRAILDQTVYGMPGIVPFQQAAPGVTYVDVEIEGVEVAGFSLGTYVDDVILTQNEPA